MAEASLGSESPRAPATAPATAAAGGSDDPARPSYATVSGDHRAAARAAAAASAAAGGGSGTPEPRKRTTKFAPRVPQTLLQQAIATKAAGRESKMEEALQQQIVAAFQRGGSGLIGYSTKQLAAVVSAMTRIEVPPGGALTLGAGASANNNTSSINGNSGLYYVESGTLKGSDGVHLVCAGATCGENGVLGDEQQVTTSSGLTAQEPSVVWAISRLLFQAVLIEQTRSKDSQRAHVLKSIPLLAPLSLQQQQRVGDVMKRREYAPGDKIVTQGEVGNTLYFIERGEVSVQQTSRGEADAKEINTHGPGSFFGETALLNQGGDGGIRNADCMAKTRVSCFTISREDFHRLLGPMHELMHIKSKARTLGAVKLLAGLTEAEREEIARLMERRNYAAGDAIITQGEAGDEFFIVESGEVKFTRVQTEGAAPEDIGTFFQNQFFGEGSLLTAAPRRASATAGVDDTVVYALSGAAFRQIFGSKVVKDMEQALEGRKAADASAEAKAKGIAVTDLNAIQILGEGSYGKVTLVRHATTGRTFAMKQITKQHVKKMRQEEHIKTEHRVLRAINHPFVCNLVRTFKNAHSVYFLMEAVLGGELYMQLKRVEKFPPSQAQFYTAQVAAVFEHLHARDIIFRDLKPENLLIAKDGYLKMVDFGLAKLCPEGKTYTLCGTPAYASPEVYASVGHDKGTDWWTLGVLLHELLAGYTPFYGKEPNQIHREITRFAKHYPRVAFPKHFPAEASDLLMGLLHPKPDHRLGNLHGGFSGIKLSTYFMDLDWDALAQKAIEPDFKPSIDDSYDAGNFKQGKNDNFARQIDADVEGAEHEPWAAEF